MQTRTISASTIKLEKWQKPKKITEDVALELSASGLHCVCFDTTKEPQVRSKPEVTTDLLSTVIPANLKWVKNPFGNTPEAYADRGLVPVLKGNKSIATYFVDGFLTEEEKNEASQQVDDLAVADPCCGSDEYDEKVTRGGNKRGGGRTCSTLFFQSEDSEVPLTFHLTLSDVWNGGKSPVRGELDNGMDHFLIPSKTPGNSVVWLAFPRSKDPKANFEMLEKWKRGGHKFAAFSGAMYTSDTLKISIVLDAVPA
ncbi:hypothetical protein [Lewinella sp. IMCC34183]|uniref:hypothetical protein n=1 Tax=Lewinella sp. IMCC34183 TaxID=2248762 RepID=UPI000E26540E|nr:hypothetical protein [Lewinella sp. IMCC34183]